jgi:hypothetical protein
MRKSVAITCNTGLAAALAMGLGACGADQGADQEFVDASPSFNALSMDIAGSDETAPSDAIAQALSINTPAAVRCHPHLFVRTHEVVKRVNRHIYKLLGRLDDFLAKQKAKQATGDERVWEHARKDGNSVRYTVTKNGEVFAWKFEMKGTGGTYALVASGTIDRSGATEAGAGKGSLTLDLGALKNVNAKEKVSGTISADFESSATARKLSVTATNVTWEIEPTMDDGSDMPAALQSLLEEPRSAKYVYFKEPGKGASLKIADQMVFACPANPALKLADVELVHRWYKAADGTRHGRSDAKMTGGQLPTATPAVDHVVAVTCHQGSENAEPAESFWLMKGESASGATVLGVAHDSTSDSPAVAASACDSAFGDVPNLDDATGDYDFGKIDFADASVVAFPGM